MLISPLMGPIVGMGLAVGTNDLDLLKRALKNFGVATLISVLTATIYFLITPISEAQSELLARTSPSLYDVLIAFCGGAAGIIAVCTRGKGNVIPGVAIATALMPPLCTAGFGLATGHLLYFLGAFYLFFINTVFIALATYCGVRLMNFKKQEYKSNKSTVRARRILTGIVIITMLPAIFLTLNIVRQSIFENNVRRFIKAELTQRGTYIISSDIDEDSLKLRIVAVGREISSAKQAEAKRHLAGYGLGDFNLRIIQGTQSDDVLMLNEKLTSLTSTSMIEKQKIANISNENLLLNKQLHEYRHYETIANDIRPEMATLFPKIGRFSIARVIEYSCDSTDSRSFVSAVIQPHNNTPLSKDETKKLHDWLKTRVKADSLIVIQRE
jgi:uncharacterized hydrophobic protein (TIGR00271 family)